MACLKQLIKYLRRKGGAISTQMTSVHYLRFKENYFSLYQTYLLQVRFARLANGHVESALVQENCNKHNVRKLKD